MQVRVREELEVDQSHPAVHPDLEGGDREGVSLNGSLDAPKHRKISHGLDREVLKHHS